MNADQAPKHGAVYSITVYWKERPALSTRTHAHNMDQSRCLETVTRSSFDAEIRWVESVLEKISKKAVSILYSKKRHRRHVLTEEKLD